VPETIAIYLFFIGLGFVPVALKLAGQMLAGQSWRDKFFPKLDQARNPSGML